jgi:hypothetical protein
VKFSGFSGTFKNYCETVELTTVLSEKQFLRKLLGKQCNDFHKLMINYGITLISGSSTIGKVERWISLMKRALVWVSGQFTIMLSSVADPDPGSGAFFLPLDP